MLTVAPNFLVVLLPLKLEHLDLLSQRVLQYMSMHTYIVKVWPPKPDVIMVFQCQDPAQSYHGAGRSLRKGDEAKKIFALTCASITQLVNKQNDHPH